MEEGAAASVPADPEKVGAMDGADLVLSTPSLETGLVISLLAAGEIYWTRAWTFPWEGSSADTCSSFGEPLTASTFFSPQTSSDSMPKDRPPPTICT